MSLITLRNDTRKKNAFLSNCFNFTWLGKYRVDIFFTKDCFCVYKKNFNFIYGDFDEGSLPYVVSTLGETFCEKFNNIKDALDYFILVCYTLVSDFSIKSSDDFDEFFDFQRIQGFQEWLPELHRYFK